jgi:hypothetical protein
VSATVMRVGIAIGDNRFGASVHHQVVFVHTAWGGGVTVLMVQERRSVCVRAHSTELIAKRPIEAKPSCHRG